MVTKADGSIIIDTQVDTSGIQKGASAIEGQFGKLVGAAKKAGVAISVAFAIKQIVAFSQACIEVGSALAEVQNVVDVTFENMSGVIDRFATESAEKFGLSELAAKQYTSTIGAMLKSMGITGDAMTTMSIKIAELAGDMASFYNLDTDTAFNKIRSGIAGETEPLKQLGVNLSEVNLEQFRMAQGISTAYSKMNQQQKALLRYHYLLKVTADAQGDFARTSGTWANQTRILSLRLQQIKADIGQGLINVLTPLLKLVNLILAAVEKLASAFRKLTEIITGKKREDTVDTSVNYDEAADGYEDLAAMIDSYSSAVDNQAEATQYANDATAQAIKLNKKYLSGLDEIHRFTTEPSTNATGSNTGNAPSVVAPVDTTGLSKLAEDTSLSKALEETKEKADSLFDTIIKNAPKALAAIGGLIANGLLALGKVSLAALTSAAQLLLTALTDLGKITLDTLAATLSSIAQIVLSGVTNGLSLLLSLLRNLAEITLDGLFRMLSMLSRLAMEGLTHTLSLVLSVLRDLAEVSIDTLLRALSELAKLGFEALADGLSLVFEALRDIGSITLTAITEALKSLSRIAFHGLETALTAVTELLGALAAHILSAAISELTTSLEKLQKVKWDNINTSLKNLKTALDDFTDNMGEGLKWFIDNALSKIDGWEAPEVFTTFLTQTSVQFAVMASMIGVLQPFWEWAWTSIFENIKTWTPGNFGSVMDLILEKLNIFSAWCKSAPSDMLAASLAFSLLAKRISRKWDQIINDSGDQLDSLKHICIEKFLLLQKSITTIAMHIGSSVTRRWQLMGESTRNIWSSFNDDLIQQWEFLRLWCKTKFDGIEQAIRVAWNVIQLITEKKWAAINETILSIWKDGIFATVIKYLDYIRSRMGRRWETLNTEAGDGWDAIKRTITVKAIKVTNTTISAFEQMYKSTTNALIRLGDNIAILLNHMLHNAITFSDYIIDMINYLDSAAFSSFAVGRVLQGLGFYWQEIPHWGQGIPLMAFSYASSRIPFLAQGAVIPPNAPFLAQLGDQKHGTNIEAPLDTIKQAVQEAGGGNRPIHIQMYLDGKVVYDTVVNQAKRQQQITGRPAFDFG